MTALGAIALIMLLTCAAYEDSREASQMGDPKKAWREWSDSRQRLLDRLGGLLAEVER